MQHDVNTIMRLLISPKPARRRHPAGNNEIFDQNPLRPASKQRNAKRNNKNYHGVKKNLYPVWILRKYK